MVAKHLLCSESQQLEVQASCKDSNLGYLLRKLLLKHHLLGQSDVCLSCAPAAPIAYSRRTALPTSLLMLPDAPSTQSRPFEEVTDMMASQGIG